MKKRPKPKHPGDILKTARIREGYNENVVIARLGVTSDVFEALEAWEIDELPDNAHLIPILKRHAEVVGVEYSDMVKAFPHALERSAQAQSVYVTSVAPREPIVFGTLLKLAAGIGVVTVIAGYVLLQTSNLGSRPKLEISSDVVSIVQIDTLEVAGETSQGSQIFINGTPVLVDENGGFKTDVVLQEGVNEISITAVNNVGAERNETLVVIRE